MSTSGRFPTHHIPDDGTRYAPGETVDVDHSSGRIQIIKDPEGAYEVMSCRPATEYGSQPPGHRGVRTTGESTPSRRRALELSRRAS